MQQAATTTPARSRLPFSFLSWLKGYDRSWLRFDVIAALTTWALVVPQSIAYGQIAGLPPQAGLFTAFGSLLGYALLGTSRQLIVSPASATAAISASLIAPLALGDAARYWSLSSLLAIIVGVTFIVYGLLKLGFVSQFIAASVQAGLMFGLGLTIIAGQVPKLLGLPAADGTFINECLSIVRNIGATNATTLLLGAASLIALLAGKRLAPKLPMPLVVVVVSIVVVTVLGLAGRGVDVIGDVGTQVPLPKIPSFELRDLGALMAGAIALSLIGYAESDTVAEEFASKNRYDIKPDQELVALGVANISSGVFQGFLVAGGASQSATNERAGAKSQLSGLLVGGLIFLTAALLMPLFANLAQAVLGAIVISAVIGFLNVPALRRIFQLRRGSFWLAMAALFGVLILGMLPGLLLAILISALMLLVAISRPRATELGKLPDSTEFASLAGERGAQAVPGLVILRLDAPMIAFNAQSARNLIRERVRTTQPKTGVVLLDMEMSFDLDVGSIDKLAQIHRELQEDGVQLWLARPHSEARRMLYHSELDKVIGADHIFQTVGEGVAAFEAQHQT